jgi:hypothetical protein
LQARVEQFVYQMTKLTKDSADIHLGGGSVFVEVAPELPLA